MRSERTDGVVARPLITRFHVPAMMATVMVESNDDSRGMAGQDLVTLEEAGRRLGITVRTVQAWIVAGKLPVYVVSPRHRFVVWSAISNEARAIADRYAQRRHRRPDTMRDAGPDTPPGDRKDDG